MGRAPRARSVVAQYASRQPQQKRCAHVSTTGLCSTDRQMGHPYCASSSSRGRAAARPCSSTRGSPDSCTRRIVHSTAMMICSTAIWCPARA